jgi:hypothetical protein
MLNKFQLEDTRKQLNSLIYPNSVQAIHFTLNIYKCSENTKNTVPVILIKVDVLTQPTF